MTLRESAISLWDTCSNRYRTNLVEYEFVVSELKRLKIKYRGVSVQVIREYPEVSFLRISERDDAIAFLIESEDSEVRRIIMAVEDLQFNYSYVTIESFLVDARWRISHNGKNKMNFYNNSLIPGRTRKICRKGISYYQEE